MNTKLSSLDCKYNLMMETPLTKYQNKTLTMLIKTIFLSQLISSKLIEIHEKEAMGNNQVKTGFGGLQPSFLLLDFTYAVFKQLICPTIYMSLFRYVLRLLPHALSYKAPFPKFSSIASSFLSSVSPEVYLLGYHISQP